MKVLTSFTIHTTSEGKRITYTYSEIDEDTGAVKMENIRDSRVILPTDANADVFKAIDKINEYTNNFLQK